jgi:hypothetical protein
MEKYVNKNNSEENLNGNDQITKNQIKEVSETISDNTNINLSKKNDYIVQMKQKTF